MARVFTDGAEFYDTLFWSSGNITVTNTEYRSGSYSYMAVNMTASKSITGLSELYFRFAFKTSSINLYLVRFRNSTNELCQIYLASDLKLHAYVNGSSVANSGLYSYSAGTWHLVEVHLKIDDSGDFEIKANGVLVIDYAGDTKPGSATTIDNIYTEIAGTPVYYDDLALNDTSGLTDNSWCGDGHIELLTPNGNGDTNNWVGSDGNSTDNYLLVDEYAHDSDTTYVKDSANNQDMYNLTDFTDTGKIVTRIYSECRAKDNDATSGTIKIGYKTDGTVYLCSSARVLTNNYARIVGDDATVNPFDSGVWENADLDAIQFVVECSSSSSSSSTTSSSSSTVIP